MLCGLILWVEWQVRQIDRRVKALERQVTPRPDVPAALLNDLRNPPEEVLRQTIDPARGLRTPDA